MDAPAYAWIGDEETANRMLVVSIPSEDKVEFEWASPHTEAECRRLWDVYELDQDDNASTRVVIGGAGYMCMSPVAADRIGLPREDLCLFPIETFGDGNGLGPGAKKTMMAAMVYAAALKGGPVPSLMWYLDMSGKKASTIQTQWCLSKPLQVAARRSSDIEVVMYCKQQDECPDDTCPKCGLEHGYACADTYEDMLADRDLYVAYRPPANWDEFTKGQKKLMDKSLEKLQAMLDADQAGKQKQRAKRMSRIGAAGVQKSRGPNKYQLKLRSIMRVADSGFAIASSEPAIRDMHAYCGWTDAAGLLRDAILAEKKAGWDYTMKNTDGSGSATEEYDAAEEESQGTESLVGGEAITEASA